MSDWDLKLVEAEVSRLLKEAADDASIRSRLRALAATILEATAPPEAPSASPPTPEPLPPLTLGQPRTPPATVTPASHRPTLTEPSENEELQAVAERFRLRAAAAWKAGDRVHASQAGQTLPESDADDPGLASAVTQFENSHYWSENPDLVRLDALAGSYEAAAAVVALVLERTKPSRGLERILPIAAEAQSALRAAIRALGLSDDPDQLVFFQWVKDAASRAHVFIKRYMRLEDEANPAHWRDLLARAEREEERLRHERPDPAVERGLDALRHDVSALLANADASHWAAVGLRVDALLAQGVPPSFVPLRNILLPLAEESPPAEEQSAGLTRVLREVDRFLATREQSVGQPANPTTTAAVSEVAQRLRGRSVVLIGGLCRRAAQDALRRAFGLSELVWIATREHQSIAGFRPIIARPEVAVVLLAIRWSSHSFGEVKAFCDDHGKPLVRLPGGYSPNQVAEQILSQVGDRLREG